MTKRLEDLSLIWASNGEAVDPDLDKNAPTFVEGKFAKGWAVEKEPHRWQNYLQQVTDLKLNIFASETFPQFEGDINYPVGSLFSVGDTILKLVSGKANALPNPDFGINGNSGQYNPVSDSVPVGSEEDMWLCGYVSSSVKSGPYLRIRFDGDGVNNVCIDGQHTDSNTSANTWIFVASKITSPKGSTIAQVQMMHSGVGKCVGVGLFRESNVVEVVNTTASEIENSVTNMTNMLNKHMSQQNPHNDNIHDIGGLTKDEINNIFQDPNDPRTIEYHIRQTGGSVHSETPEQVGTIPASGGAFTGLVNFIRFRVGSVGIFANDLSFKNRTVSLSDIINSALTDANYTTYRINNSNLFRLPAPIRKVFLSGKVDAHSFYSGDYSIDNINTTPQGWPYATNVALSGFNTGATVTYVMEYIAKDGSRKIVLKDLKDNHTFLSSLVVDLAGTDMQLAVTILAYPQLSNYQKSNFMVM